MKNVIINGSLQVWQRGTSFNNPASGAYLADHWLTQYGSPSIGTFAVSRQPFAAGQTAVPGNPHYYMRFAKSVAASVNTYHTLSHRIEDVLVFAGETVTLSFYAKANANRTISATVWQNFGTGGSSTVQVTNVTPALTTSWQRFTYTFAVSSISGKSIGANNYLYVDFYLEQASQNPQTTYTIDIAQVQLEKGSSATDVEQVTFGDDLNRCRRYYWKTFPYDVAPGYNMGNTGAITNKYHTPYSFVHVRFPVQMRKTPTITTWNPDNTNGDWRQYGENKDQTNSMVGNGSQDCFTVLPAVYIGVTPSDDTLGLHVTADAEF